MKVVTLKNWMNKEILIIETADYVFENYQHTFMKIENKEWLLKASYSSKNWDVIDIEYLKA